jgi:hypothetical protein
MRNYAEFQRLILGYLFGWALVTRPRNGRALPQLLDTRHPTPDTRRSSRIRILSAQRSLTSEERNCIAKPSISSGGR